MVPNEIPFQSVAALAPLIRRRELSPVEVVQAVLARIERLEPVLHSFITLMPEAALAAARAAEAEISAGRYRGPLHGIPVAHKDIFETAGVRTTGHSRVLVDHVPHADAEAVRRWAEAGAISLGKLNTFEFACGGTAVFGVPVNPWDTARTTGGSSAGSGSALAARLVFGATGSDTGGSIRAPSALCGVTGLKPTYGRVSRRGVLPLSWSLDHVGPMARTVEDVAILLQALAGHDPLDPGSADRPVPDYVAALAGLGTAFGGPGGAIFSTGSRPLRGVRVGLPRGRFAGGADAEVISRVLAAVRQLERFGAEPVELDLPGPDLALAAYQPVMGCEAVRFHERWLRERPGDYAPVTRQRLLQGARFSGADYVRGQQARALLCQAYDAALGQVHLIAEPTQPYPAYRIEDPTLVIDGAKVDARAYAGAFTRAADLTGLPAISLPCGFTGAGLPIGLQLVGRAFDEPTVLRVAQAYQLATDWHLRRPPDDLRPAGVTAAPPPRGEPDPADVDRARAVLREGGFPADDEDAAVVAAAYARWRQAVASIDAGALDRAEPAMHRVPGSAART